MIVGGRFEGDVDKSLMAAQHDVYWDALRTIVRKCEQLTKFARNLLGDEAHPGWGEHERFDHRTLQMAHDLIAAAWRYRFAPIERTFPFADQNSEYSADVSCMRGWLKWLEAEIGQWVKAPHLVRSVEVILTHQNQDEGYVAEQVLYKDLISYFQDVPWEDRVRKALQNAGQSLNASSTGSEAKSNSAAHSSVMLCDCTAIGRAACNMIPCKTLAARAMREGWGPLE